MSYISKKEIEKMIKRGDKNKYSHVIICLDHFDYEYFPKYVKYDEDINDIINEISNKGYNEMLSIKEVYNYNLDLDMQLNEQRAYHIEPLKEIQKVQNSKTKEALEYATLMHKGQTRHDGSEYINHPIRVANYVSQFKKSKELDMLIICAYLHDTLEDTKATYYDLIDKFGIQVASIVLELTTDEDLKNEIGKETYLKFKMKNMSSWALVIKLCDRLDNITDSKNSDEKFRQKYIKETETIINFLLNNRKLSKTHLSIIKEISKELLSINILEKIKIKTHEL